MVLFSFLNSCLIPSNNSFLLTKRSPLLIADSAQYLSTLIIEPPVSSKSLAIFLRSIFESKRHFSIIDSVQLGWV